jgi:hypothetical protein
MDQTKRDILKKYIRRILLESDVVDIESGEDVALASELNKPANKGFLLNKEEISQIETAIKSRDPKISSFEVDLKQNQIVFDRNISNNNFHYVIRKTKNQMSPNEYKYTMWYAPFKNREDIGKPGNVNKKESDKFDINIDSSTLLSVLYNFITNALLMN